MTTLTVEYEFADKAGKVYSGIIRNVPDGNVRHARLSRLVEAWTGAKSHEWTKLDCYSNSSVAKAVRARMDEARK